MALTPKERIIAGLDPWPVHVDDDDLRARNELFTRRARLTTVWSVNTASSSTKTLPCGHNWTMAERSRHTPPAPPF